MRNEKGFILIWAAVASAVVLMLSTAAFFALSSAMRRSLAMEIATDETLIAQEALEKAKYGYRFSESFSIPTEVERNGRIYEVYFSETGKTVEGVEMVELTCEVVHEEGSFALSTMVEDSEE